MKIKKLNNLYLINKIAVLHPLIRLEIFLKELFRELQLNFCFILMGQINFQVKELPLFLFFAIHRLEFLQ